MPLDRASALRAVIAYEIPIDAALSDLRGYGWDADAPLATLTRNDILRILERYVAAELTSQQVTHWADVVEGRDDVELSPGDEEVVADAIFRLATPELNEGLTLEVATRIIDELRAK